jgi:hypothetical protein
MPAGAIVRDSDFWARGRGRPAPGIGRPADAGGGIRAGGDRGGDRGERRPRTGSGGEGERLG